MKSNRGAGFAGMVLSIFFSVAACSGHTTTEQGPLVGTWGTTLSAGGLALTLDLDLNGDDTGAAISVSGSPGGVSCSGSISLTGYTWTSTATTISLSGGPPQCSGSITCGGQTADCTSFTGVSLPLGMCTYTLSSDDNTLTLTCPTDAGPGTPTALKRGG
jgi:hypothetical protein